MFSVDFEKLANMLHQDVILQQIGIASITGVVSHLLDSSLQCRTQRFIQTWHEENQFPNFASTERSATRR